MRSPRGVCHMLCGPIPRPSPLLGRELVEGGTGPWTCSLPPEWSREPPGGWGAQQARPSLVASGLQARWTHGSHSWPLTGTLGPAEGRALGPHRPGATRGQGCPLPPPAPPNISPSPHGAGAETMQGAPWSSE